MRSVLTSHDQSRGQAGSSLLEVLVALAILTLIVVQVSLGFTGNLDARLRNERQLKFVAVDTALRNIVFRRLSDYVEGNVNCAKPKASLRKVWSAAGLRELRLVPLQNLQTSKHPPTMVRRCRRQSFDEPLAQGIYTCFELRAGGGSGSDGRRFLEENDAYAETFFALWDVARDRATTCTAFTDAVTPTRGGRLHYVLYWRPKAKAGAVRERRFSSYTGIMYGQTKSKD